MTNPPSRAEKEKGDHAFRERPKGSVNGGYVRARVQIGFDDETRKAITRWAKFDDLSFTAEVRELVARGLKTRTR
jgi:hypothetical protein